MRGEEDDESKGVEEPSGTCDAPGRPVLTATPATL